MDHNGDCEGSTQNNDRANILIVGDEGVGKDQLSRLLVNCECLIKRSFNLSIHMASDLRSFKKSNFPDMDMVIFMTDLKQAKSFTTLKESLHLMDAGCFMGKACFLVNNVSNVMEESVPLGTVSALSEAYCAPMFSLDMEDDEGRSSVVRQLLTLLEVSMGRTRVTPLLVSSSLKRCNYTTL